MKMIGTVDQYLVIINKNNRIILVLHLPVTVSQ